MRGWLLRGFVALSLIATNVEASGQPKIEERCGDVMDMMRYALQGVRAENSSFSLKRNKETYHMLMASKVDPAKSRDGRLYAPWRLLERQGESTNYCVVGSGEWVEALASLHMANPRLKYGMPGSGHQRCANTNDVMDNIDVRMWANKELGDSFTLFLYSDIGTKDYTFLMTDRHWVLLDQTKGQKPVTCYFARGDDLTIHKDFKMPPR
ncbi:MAG: hypothetical protein EPO55_07415 [Reyranella sp.]|uniref:hypothetical protein n=1 Tax=Reyranella sp. TaxID=1929291 RepID=UPI001201977D|nr:hypothetical protein [Reyranella sp.]TAJ40919.1 MAG: hypothetical protein EPO55_07415 [Reyranella sp.]